MIDKIIFYLQRYLILVEIVYLTFFVPLAYFRGVYSGASIHEGIWYSIDGGLMELYFRDELEHKVIPFITYVALVLIVLSGYKFFVNKLLYRKQFFTSLGVAFAFYITTLPNSILAIVLPVYQLGYFILYSFGISK